MLMLDAEIGEVDAAAAERTPVPVEVNVLAVPEVSLVELTQVWTLGVGSDRSLGRPKEWNGEPSGFDYCAFKFSNWLSGLPGDAERFLVESVTMAQPIQWVTLTPREKFVSRRVATALGALIGGKALTCIRHHFEKLNGFEMWSLLFREYKPDTATRKVGLLERVMDDQPASGMDFGEWFLRWPDLVGECEKARGRMIDDAIKVAVMLKRSPKELRDHLVLESPQLANVEFKFPVMRELIQHWCQSRRVFFPQKPPMEVAAVSTAARDSDVTVSAVGWHGSWHEKEHGKGKRERGKEKERQGKERQGERKGNWWHEHHDQKWMEPSRGSCGHCWKWGHKKAQCPQRQRRRSMEFGATVTHPSQTVSDPGSSVSQRVEAVNSSPVSLVCCSESVDDEKDWPDEWWHD